MQGFTKQTVLEGTSQSEGSVKRLVTKGGNYSLVWNTEAESFRIKRGVGESSTR